MVSLSDRVERTNTMSVERTSRSTRLACVRAWVSVFAPVAVPDLEGFDLVVLGSMSAAGSSCLSLADVTTLQAQGILVLAHLPLVTSTGDGAVRSPATGSATGVTAAVPGDVSQAGWPLSTVAAARSAIDNGFDGVYLDELFQDQQATEPRSGFEGLVRCIRDCCPDGLLLTQRVPMPLDPALVDGVGHARPLLESVVEASRPDVSPGSRDVTPVPDGQKGPTTSWLRFFPPVRALDRGTR